MDQRYVGIAFSRQRLKLIEQSKSRFVSRGDNSDTHNLEKSLWKQAGIQPKGDWYIEAGQGMGATLGIANERDAYNDEIVVHNQAPVEQLALGTP